MPLKERGFQVEDNLMVKKYNLVNNFFFVSGSQKARDI